MANGISSVFHNWAHNITNGPRSRFAVVKAYVEQGNVHFDPQTRTIYSYGHHFPMARFLTDPQGETIVAFTRRTYSNSTAKHLSYTRGAIPHGVPVYLVPEVEDRMAQDWAAAHEAYCDEALAFYVKAKRSRKYGESLIADAQRALRKARELNERFSLGLVTPDEMNEAEVARIIAEQREAAREATRREQERQAAQRAHDAQAFADWKNGMPVYCPASYRRDEHGSAALRTIGENVETSQGASVPLPHAVRAFRFVKLCRMAGRGYEANGHSVRVGHFTVARVTPDGDVTVGCHFFTWAQLHDWAQREGLADVAASDEALTVTEEAAR